MLETAEISGSVIKSGQTCVQLILSRGGRKAGDPPDWKGGMKVTVRALPRLEEFMQSLGQGTVDPQASGRYWMALDGQPMAAYVIQSLHPVSDDGMSITLEKLGQPLIVHNVESGIQQVNLSPLRLRGISESEGITFGVRGVYSLTEMEKIRDRLVAASRRFYDEYVRPVEIAVTIYGSTSEVKL